jgi:hypothetical protein
MKLGGRAEDYERISRAMFGWTNRGTVQFQRQGEIFHYKGEPQMVMSGGPMAEVEASPRQLTMTERLVGEEKQLTERLAQVRQIRESLEAMPEVQKVIDGLTALGQIRNY